ncbi:oleosin-like [Solanum dulcamara]|uniref:oleosin-like n=1 Tax=Solanum dulcamara TaxID=45834 RepID=UPI0024851C37|nr:oleosin-like [Solanum dulcamara]
MATRPPNFFNNSQSRPSLRPIHTTYVPSFLRKLLQPHVPNSTTQLMGFLTLVISGGILLLLTGVTITTIILGLIFFTPLIFITSPIWILLFIAAAGFLFAAFTLGAITWVYRYFTRRSMVDDDSADMKDYSREFGGYLHAKVKDTAPGA